MLRLIFGIAVCGCLCCLPSLALGGEAPPPTPTLDDLAKKNADLEKQVQELRKIVDQLKPKEGAPPLEEKSLREEIDALKKALPAAKPPVVSSVQAELYGFIKLDASYDTSHVRPGNYAYWVDSEETNRHDNQFNMTANETRIGVRLAGPKVGDEGMLKGQIEFDFYGGGLENKSTPMLRQAFGMIEWPNYDFSVLAGQTWDIISPLAPNSLNYIVNGFTGNIGYRRPQVRVTQGFEVDEQSKLKLEGGVTRTLGDTPVYVGDKKESGEDAGFPTMQGRVSLTFPLLTEKKTTLGVSGHWGQEEYDIDTAGSFHTFNTWSGNVDLDMPVAGIFGIKGECYTGKNLDTFVGGIGYGVNTIGADTSLWREIDAKGGWICGTITPTGSPWEFNLGTGTELNDRSDLASMPAKTRKANANVFGNAIYNINKAAQVGLEVSGWNTSYVAAADGNAIRVESAFKYKF